MMIKNQQYLTFTKNKKRSTFAKNKTTNITQYLLNCVREKVAKFRFIMGKVNKQHELWEWLMIGDFM